MGGSKKQTVGYEYPYDLQFGLCYAADALLELRGGDATAWSGRIIENTTVNVNAPNLWGGKDNGGEGGIVGPMDVLFGGSDQEVHPYLAGEFEQESALRGKVTVLLRNTIYGAYNPYPKPPAFKLERVFDAWPDDDPWYPEKAVVQAPSEVVLPVTADGWEYQILPYHPEPGFENLTPPDSGWQLGQSPFGEGWTWPGQPAANTVWPEGTIIWMRRSISVPRGARAHVLVRAENGCVIFLNGREFAAVNRENVQLPLGDVAVFEIPPGNHQIAVKGFDEHPTLGDTYLSVEIELRHVRAMNPAHMLYYSKVAPTMEGLPASQMDDANWRAAADRFHAEAFGLCTEWVPGAESVEQFQQRICNVVGAFLAKSRRDGKWRLHVPRGVYDINALPELTDDDILEWKEEPSVLEDAVNQLQTRWFDPELKEARITPSEHALAAVDAFGGVISQTADYPEIPSELLAMRKNSQELRARSTPTRRISPICNRRAALWESGTYVVGRFPKRGISEVVLLLLRVEPGESPTSAVRLVAAEDIWSLPQTTYLGPQPPVDLNPPQIPLPASAQRAFEAPYIELAATLPSGELQALPAESGFLQFVAGQPASGLNFTLATAASGEDFEEYGLFDWCPTALVVEGADRVRTEFTLDKASRLESVGIGTAVLWDDEICRVDALDRAAVPPTITLGRGCADTVPAVHTSGSRLWFYDEWAATDQREYALGEVVAATALSRTRSDRLGSGEGPVSTTEMNERSVRPYPPGRLRISDAIGDHHAFPHSCIGELTVSWAHRDRVLQADQLIDSEVPSVGPEPGTTYTVRYYVDDEILHTESYISGDVATPVVLPVNGVARIEVEAIRDGFVSWQAATATFNYSAYPNRQRTVVGGDRRVTVNGDNRISRG